MWLTASIVTGPLLLSVATVVDGGPGQAPATLTLAIGVCPATTWFLSSENAEVKTRLFEEPGAGEVPGACRVVVAGRRKLCVRRRDQGAVDVPEPEPPEHGQALPWR